MRNYTLTPLQSAVTLHLGQLSSAADLAVLMLLQTLADNKGVVEGFSVSDLALSIGHRTTKRVRSALHFWSNLGAIEVVEQYSLQDGGRTTNKYRLLLPEHKERENTESVRLRLEETREFNRERLAT